MPCAGSESGDGVGASVVVSVCGLAGLGARELGCDMRFPRWLAVLAASEVLLGGAVFANKAEPKSADVVKLVPSTERSAHFGEVNDKLESGGILFGYFDIDGDMLRLATAFVPEDFSPLFVNLSLTDVKALVVSSVASTDYTSFRSRQGEPIHVALADRCAVSYK